MKIKKLSFQNEVAVIVAAHEEAVRDGSRAEMAVAEVAMEELVAMGMREVARL